MPSLVAALVLALLHAGAGVSRVPDQVTDQRWLSAAGGVALAYVFVHLLPWLAEVQEAVVRAGVLSWLERHVYLVALAGVMTFYALEQLARRSKRRTEHGRASDTVGWVRMASYTAYNGLIGYVLPQPDRGHGSSLWLFTFAMAVAGPVRRRRRRLRRGGARRVVGAPADGIGEPVTLHPVASAGAECAGAKRAVTDATQASDRDRRPVRRRHDLRADHRVAASKHPTPRGAKRWQLTTRS